MVIDFSNSAPTADNICLARVSGIAQGKHPHGVLWNIEHKLITLPLATDGVDQSKIVGPTGIRTSIATMLWWWHVSSCSWPVRNVNSKRSWQSIDFQSQTSAHHMRHNYAVNSNNLALLIWTIGGTQSVRLFNPIVFRFVACLTLLDMNIGYQPDQSLWWRKDAGYLQAGITTTEGERLSISSPNSSRRTRKTSGRRSPARWRWLLLLVIVRDYLNSSGH